ncbi:MAG: aminotransferase class V-fold PLP-dependent enzyme, partial [Oscillospiraceae bacterium]|nr:aminotransferase class V-fold PLP-dependent enzyme [Oscillospiraceae bacterium]
MTEIYFDNSATTRVCPEAAETALRTMTAGYGNPSSVHHMGAAAARELASARQTIADCLKASPGEVSFLSCGTEANNTVLFGASQLDPKRRRILVSAVEHPSVQQPAKYLLSKGYDVHFLPVDEQGRVRLDATAELLDEHTALISVMQVNNETGAVQPLKDIGALVREKAPQALFHVDGVQAFCRLPAELKLWQADAYSMSGHKIHAPKGIGALWLRSGRRIPPLLLGGGQEKGFRSGTEAMPNIMAFAAAARIA